MSAVFTASARRALQWRLLLLWLLAMALPLVLAVLPLWATLSRLLDHSLLRTQLLAPLDAAALVDTLMTLPDAHYTPASALGGLIVFVLLLPVLSGLAMTAARAPAAAPVPGFAELLQGALREYGRMARLWLWALLPLGIALGIGGALNHAAGEQAQTMILQSDARWLGRGALAVSALLLLLAHATVDAARAQLVLEPRRRSVVAAWWRGTKRLLRRPRGLVLYALVTAAGLLLAALLGFARLYVAPVDLLSFVLALLLGQALVAVLAWMRCARLFALVEAQRR